MIRVNENYLKLQSSWLFSDIAKKVSAFQSAHPDTEIIKLGIGDVTRPLPPACLDAFHDAVDDLGSARTFRGYGPDQGYEFLREAIVQHDYPGLGLTADEVFVSDGAKCDTANIQELFAAQTRVAVPDPVYPVYVDTNVMAGRTGDAQGERYAGLVYLESTRENGFVPAAPDHPVDLIYLCFPNNPTGAVATKEVLSDWVDFARENKSIIFFDAAYEAFITEAGIPHSIYEIEGAKTVAIEFRSFSKTAGFTGTRCAFTVVPKSCVAYDGAGQARPVHSLWARRQSTKFNGVCYPVQRAAAAIYSEEGAVQVRGLCDYYLRNAALIRERMMALGYECTGGENSPYIWVNAKRDSWEFFDLLLQKAAVVCTPGSGFGTCGEGYVRISAFNSHEHVQRAMDRISSALKG